MASCQAALVIISCSRAPFMPFIDRHSTVQKTSSGSDNKMTMLGCFSLSLSFPGSIDCLSQQLGSRSRKREAWMREGKERSITKAKVESGFQMQTPDACSRCPSRRLDRSLGARTLAERRSILLPIRSEDQKKEKERRKTSRGADNCLITG